MTITTLRAWLGLLLLSAVLTGCGGGTADDTTTQIRLLNASPDLASANLYTSGDLRAGGVATDTISGYSELDPDTYTVKVTDAIGVTLASVSQELDKKNRYTAVAWGRSGATSVTVLTEADSDTDGMNSGWGRLRVFNSAGNEAGNLDVYLVANSTGTLDLSGSTPALAGTTTTLTSYSDLLAGTYRLVVTAAGDSSDVRLDLPSFTLGDQQLLTLVIEPSAGGTLVNSLILAHQGSLSIGKNTSARVRLLASVATGGGLVKAGIGGVALTAAGLTSPQIGAYTLVPAGASPIAITVNGLAVVPDSSVTSFTPGADYSLLVAGTASAPTETTLADDNRLPTNTAKAKIRLIDGYAAGGTATLAVNSVGTSTVITPPDASVYSQIAASSAASANVTTSTGISLWATSTTTTTTIAAGGVYTVFILDGGTAPLGQLLSER